MFNRSQALFGKAKALAQKRKQAQAFFSNPKNLKLFQQVSPSQPQVCLPCALQGLLSSDGAVG
jgi:hypothetical protein